MRPGPYAMWARAGRRGVTASVATILAHEIRHRDRPGSAAASDRRGRARRRNPPRRLHPLRPRQGEGLASRDRARRGPARGAARARLGDHADSGGRRQVDDHRRSRSGAQSPGQESDHRAARAVARTLLRREGGSRGRRLLAGRADGGHQPPFHRRLPGDHRRAQPARGDARQPPPPRQRPRHRSARHSVSPRARHERPRAARRGHRSRRQGQRRAPRDGLRHHGRLRGDGHPLPRAGPRGPQGALRRHRGRATAATPRPCARGI